MLRPLALLCSVALEADPVRERLADPGTSLIGGKPGITGTLAGRPVILLAAGMGKVNAAQGLTAILERHPVAGVVGFGVGGAYPGGPPVGGLAVATEEVYGDEGVDTPSGWISTQEIGIPLAQGPHGPIFNRFPLDEERVRRACAALAGAGSRAVAGAFATVSACSGTAARGAEIAGRFGAICESMEGAAGAHVAALYGVPYLEVRGISNLVVDRDLGAWRLGAAAAAAAAAVELLVGNWLD